MNPNNGQTPLDYLNQIAPQTTKSSGFKLNIRTVIIISIVLIIIVSILAAIGSSAGSSKKTPWQQLSARLTTTQTIATESTTKLKNSQLRSLNSDLKLYLTNTQRDLAAPLAFNEINIEKLPKELVAEEAGTEMIERLEDGRLNAKFDSTYAREMSYHLSTILALYQELNTSSKNAEVKKFLSSAYDNLYPTQQSLSNFSASSE